MATDSPRKTIGEINGVWQWLFKMALLVQAFLIPIGSWLFLTVIENAKEISENAKEIAVMDGNRYKPADANRDFQAVWAAIHGLPPDDFENRVAKLEHKVDQVLIDIAELKTIVRNRN